ncbi:MAG: hypothetical protein ACRCW3_02415 [Metamycoplasmataceae bacterium]
MKKILLGTGALALAVIPVAAMVSCSSSESKTTLQKEADKFKTPVKTKVIGMKSSDAAGTIIYDTPTPASKKEALLKLADVPTLDSEYEFSVLAATVDATTKTTINVEIEVYSGANEAEKIKVEFKVTDFGMPATLADEVDKWGQPHATKEPTKTAAAAITEINDAEDATKKWQALHRLSTLPIRGAGFTYEVLSAAPDGTTNTTMSVTIRITDTLSNATDDVVFPVTGFAAP